MLRCILKSKIHNAKVKKLELNYEASIGIDKALLDESKIIVGERVQVLNYNNGMRFETYVIEEERGSGVVCLYGPSARLAEVGDKICILSYALVNNEELKTLQPITITVDENNKIVKIN